MQLSVHLEDWDLVQPFRISGAEWLTAPGIVVEIVKDGCIGRGEAQGVYYSNETAQSMAAQVDAVANELRAGISRDQLQQLLPAGGARNAIDCALWDLECKLSGQTIWQLLDMDPKPVTTVFTIGIEPEPEQMAELAAAASDAPILKIKLDADRPVEKLAAIRAARPDATLVVDANQGWDFDLLRKVLPQLFELGLSMLEQPLPRDADRELEGFSSPIVLAADESCLDCSEYEQAASRYDMINIKLDKTGGLTEALKLAKLARRDGKKLMVGNMVGTSLAMAPSFVVAQLCDFVDIDGPLLLKYDRPDGLVYRKGIVDVFDSALWG